MLSLKIIDQFYLKSNMYLKKLPLRCEHEIIDIDK